MDKLKELVRELETASEKPEIEAKLQAIGKALVTDYVIEVDGVTVRPLWVEAYYHNENVFDDPFVHKKDEQKKSGVLYFHHKTDDKRNGVDICLSLGEYYLSFLLKYTLVDGIVRSQSELSPLIREKYKKSGVVITEKKNPTDVISYAARIGLSSCREKDAEKKALKEEYKDCKLSVVRNFDKNFGCGFKFPKREALVREYLKRSVLSKTEKAEFCRNVLGYCPGEYKD